MSRSPDDRSAEDTARAVLHRHGTTYAEEAGIRLKDQPAPLFQLLVLALLLSARISADIAVGATRQLLDAGFTTPEKMRDATWQQRVDALGRGGYRRYDERTATQLGAAAELVLDRFGGDLRRLADEAEHDVDKAADLLQDVKGVGPTGADVFLREVQAVWPWARPYLDDRARRGAARVGLSKDVDALADVVGPDDLARLAAGLVRVSLVGKNDDPLAG
jgi:endonuclease III